MGSWKRIGGLLVLAVLAGALLRRGGERGMAMKSGQVPARERDARPLAPPPLPSAAVEEAIRRHETAEPAGGFHAGVIPTNETNPRIEQVLLKGPDGRLIRLDHAGASGACGRRGMRLPTVRELATLARSRGAAGILDSADGLGREAEERISRITATDPGGKIDAFVYDPYGFKPDSNPQNIPEDSGAGGFWLQGHWFWSGSRSDCPPDESAKFCAYVFDAQSGMISAKYDTVPLAVACVKDGRAKP